MIDDTITDEPVQVLGKAPMQKSFTRSLMVRVAIFLSVALLPIGLVAIDQTWRALNYSNDNIEAGLHARTSALVVPERRALFTKLGVVQALADTIGIADLSADECVALMQRAVSQSDRIVFAGFSDLDAISTCNNINQEFDFSDNPGTQFLYENPQRHFSFNARGEASGEAVIIVSQPVYDAADEFLGIVSLSFPAEPLLRENRQTDQRDVMIVTFNADGQVLSALSPDGPIKAYLPPNATLETLAAMGDTYFTGESQSGETRLISIVPIIEGQVFALGSWGPSALRQAASPGFFISTLLFPILMWAVGILVSLIALNRLVLRHIRDLGRRMQNFAHERHIANAKRIGHAPSEIQEINQTFEYMAEEILRDEADLENAIFERGVLLKEVHHRVKNNLQLISSIINMQVRQAQNPEAITALRQFQERVTSLASVHRALYQEPSLSELRLDNLIGDLVSQLTAIGAKDQGKIDVETDLADVRLLPDQASAVAMVTTEALANAFKYGGAIEEGEPFRLKVKLTREMIGDECHVRLHIGNSVGPEDRNDNTTGLGRRLIAAFVSQLDGKVEETDSGDWYSLDIEFIRKAFEPS